MFQFEHTYDIVYYEGRKILPELKGQFDPSVPFCLTTAFMLSRVDYFLNGDL